MLFRPTSRRLMGTVIVLVFSLCLSTPAYAFVTCPDEASRTEPCRPEDPDNPLPSPYPLPPVGYTGLPNPAQNHFIKGTSEDPLAMFSRRPLDKFIVPGGGLFMDPSRDEPHYGVDYAYPDSYLLGERLFVYPVAPGYVTTRSSCVMCFAEGSSQGRVLWRHPQYNFGFGDVVIIETPYNADVSLYTMYAHLQEDFVSLGDYVTPDEVLGVAGTSGYAEQIHLHLEIRFGTPGKFWNADFSQWTTRENWLSTMFANPALLMFPEFHADQVKILDAWVALQPRPNEMP